MKNLKKWVAAVAAVFLCGCFQVEDELTLQPDGSGAVKLTVHSTVPDEMKGMLGMTSPFGGSRTPLYPPVSEAEARHFFPGKSFTIKAEDKDTSGGKTLVVEATFKDINALLNSPYAQAHQLSLDTNKSGALRLRALSGGQTLVQAMQMKMDGEMAGFEMPGMDDLKKKKGEMRFQFRVTLPNPITEATGTRENKTVTWGADRAKCKDDDEFASRLSGVLEASCSAEGLKFSPVTPPRLGLVPFGELAAGKSASASAPPDTNAVLKAARFVPYALHVTRSLDLTGEGSAGNSLGQLSGAVVVPTELAPQRWGETKLEEAVDGKGNSLVPKEGGDEMSRIMRYSSFSMNDESDDEGEPDAPRTKNAAEKEHAVSLTFKAPEWKVKEIAKVKGHVDLEYLGGSEVVKLSNAVPASLVMDMSNRSSMSFDSDSERGLITDSRLAELGLSLRVQMAMVQSGMTMLSLEAGGGKSALVDAQVFDAEGRPWPTSIVQQDSGSREERSCQVIVAGKPKPPLSLAVAVSAVGTSIAVPIQVENVPVGNK